MSNEVEKAYYTQGEVATLFNVTKKTIRAWEKNGMFPNCVGGGKAKRYLIADVEKLDKGKKPEEGKPSESKELREATEATNIATQQAKLAKQRDEQEESEINIKVRKKGWANIEEGLEEVKHKTEEADQIVKEAEQRKREVVIKEENYEEEKAKVVNAWAKVKATKEESDAILKEARKVEERGKKFAYMLYIEGEEAEVELSDMEYYNAHMGQGTRLLKGIAKGIAPYHKGLADYLNRQVARLENGIGYEQGMSIFKACSRNIVKISSWFLFNAGVFREFDTTSLSEWLNDGDERLVVLMGILWEHDLSTTESPMGIPLKPPQQKILDTIRKRVTPTLTEGVE